MTPIAPRHFRPKVPAGVASRRRASEKRLAAEILRRLRRRWDGGAAQPGGAPCPVEPNRPLDLSGGAAAALEFDD